MLELVGGRTLQRNVAGDALVNLHRLLVLDLVRIELQRFLEAIDRLAVPVAVEVAEAEVVDRLFVFGIEFQRRLERLDGAFELALVVKDRAEQIVGLRQLLDLNRFLEELLRAKELALARVDRAEGEVREERLLRDLNRAAEPAFGAFQILTFVQQHAVENGSVEMIGLHFERAFEVMLGAIEIAVVEKHLAEEERELVIVAIKFEGFFERLDAAIGIERIDGRLSLGEELQESLAPLAAEERHDPVFALGEALLLFESEHLLAHLRFPKFDELVGGDDVLALEQFLDGEQSGLIDEDGALVFLHGIDDAADRLCAALDDLFETGDALEQMLIERYVAFFVVLLDLVLFERCHARKHEQLRLAAEAILALVVIQCTTGLTEHVCAIRTP